MKKDMKCPDCKQLTLAYVGASVKEGREFYKCYKCNEVVSVNFKDLERLILDGASSDDRYLDFEEASEFLNIKHSMLRKLVFNKSIPFYSFGRCLRFNKKEIEEWITTKKQC